MTATKPARSITLPTINLPARVPTAPVVLAVAWLVILPLAVHDANAALDAFTVTMAVLVAGSFVPASKRAHALVAATLATFLLVRVLSTVPAYVLPTVALAAGFLSFVSPGGLSFTKLTRHSRAALSGLVVSALVVLGVYKIHPFGDKQAGFLPWSWSLLAAVVAMIACAFFALAFARSLVDLALTLAPVLIGALLVCAFVVHAIRAASYAVAYGLVLVLTLSAYALLAVLDRAKHRRNAGREKARNADNFARAAFKKLGWTEAALTAKSVTPLWVVAMWPYELEHERGAQIRLRYAPGWDGDEAALTELAGKLHGGVWTSARDYSKDHLVLTRAGEIFAWPRSLAYRDLALDRRDLIPLGVRDGGDPFVWELGVPQYAHCLLGGQSGSGKTNATRLLIVGFVRNGGLVDVLDAKGGEDFEDFAGNPAIRVHTEPDAMVTAIRDFEAEYQRRKATRGAARDALPRRMLLLDETAEIKTLIDVKLGKDSLAWYVGQLLSLTALVRSSRMHIVCSTQKPVATALTGNGTTGAQLRDLLGWVVGLGKLSPSASTMLFGDTNPPPVSERDAGRGVVFEGGTFATVQTARLDLDEAVRLAVGTARFADDDPMADFEDDLAVPADDDRPTCPVVPIRLVNSDPDESVEPPSEWLDRAAPDDDVGDVGRTSRARAHRGFSAPPPHPFAPPDPHPPEPARTPDPHPSAPLAAPLNPGPGPTAMACLGCSHGWLTPAKAGSTVRCPACRKPRKVPVPK